MKMTIEEAYRLAVKKWEYIVNNDGSDIGLCEAIPVLKKLPSNCSYCSLFASMMYDCKGCPLQINQNMLQTSGCVRLGHPYNTWFDDKTRENAQKVLDLIVKTNPL